MVRAFFSNRSLILLLLPFVLATYVLLNNLFGYYEFSERTNLGLWATIILNPTLSSIISASLILTQAILINTVFNRIEFMERNNYFPALFYVIFMSQFDVFYQVSGLSISLFLSGLALYQLLRLNQNEDGRKNVFNASFLLGLSATFFPLLILTVPVLFWIVWILRPFVFREAFLAIIGFVLPFIYLIVFKFLDQSPFVWEEFYLIKSINTEGHHFLSFVGIMVLLFISCLNWILKKWRHSSIRLKKILRVFAILLVYSLALGGLEYVISKSVESIALAVLPLSFLVTYGFGEREPEQISELLFYVLILFSCGKFFLPLTYSLPEIF